MHRNDKHHIQENVTSEEGGRQRNKGEKQRKLQLHLPCCSSSMIHERSKYDNYRLLDLDGGNMGGGAPTQGRPRPPGDRQEQPAPRLHSTASLSTIQNQDKGTKLLMERGLGFLKLQLLPLIFWPQKVPCGTQVGA